MRANAIGVMLGAVLCATPAVAYDTYDSRTLFANPMFTPAPDARGAYDPRDCAGAEWDDASALVVSKVTARPRVNFVKSPHDIGSRATNCPAATDACRKSAYLVTGDLVLGGRTRDGFTCVSYQSPSTKNPAWTEGWLPSVALSPVAPMPRPAPADWQGTWTQPGGTIEIKPGGIGGRLRIEGEMVILTARNVRTGVIDAQVDPAQAAIAFLEDGWLPFETKCDSGCRVRMQRIGPWLAVQDNGDCGGAGVSFTGLYRRKP